MTGRWANTRTPDQEFRAAIRVPDDLVCEGSFELRAGGFCSTCGQTIKRQSGATADVAARHKMPPWLAGRTEAVREHVNPATVCACGRAKNRKSVRCNMCAGRGRPRTEEPSGGMSALGVVTEE